MSSLDQAGALILTHLPYWVIAVYLVVVARRTRRAIEAAIRELSRPGSRDP